MPTTETVINSRSRVCVALRFLCAKLALELTVLLLRFYFSHAGLGFVILGKVVDGKLLSRIAAQFWSAIVFITPFVVSSMAPGDRSAHTSNLMEVNACNLDSSQRNSIRTIAVAVTNANCSYGNVTLESILEA